MRYTFILLVLLGCTGVAIKKEAGDSSGRIGTTGITKPNFFIQDYKITTGRFVASESDDESLSNKQLYFLTLWEQTHKLKTLLGRKEQIKICPGFHNEILTFEEVMDATTEGLTYKKNYSTALEHPERLPSYPVMALPYSNSDVYSYLKKNPDADANLVVEQALNRYMNVLEREIETLCFHGVSDDYYIFENYITYGKKDEQLKAPKEIMSAVFRIPVFANLLLLESFKTHQILASNVMTDVALERSELEWLRSYLYELEKIRHHDSEVSLNKIGY